MLTVFTRWKTPFTAWTYQKDEYSLLYFQILDLKGVLNMSGETQLYILMKMNPSWLVVLMDVLVDICFMKNY